MGPEERGIFSRNKNLGRTLGKERKVRLPNKKGSQNHKLGSQEKPPKVCGPVKPVSTHQEKKDPHPGEKNGERINKKERTLKKGV